MRKWIGLVCAVLAAAMLLTALLYGEVAAIAMNVASYPKTKLFAGMAEELVGYLRNELPVLSHIFIDREIEHMKDVKALFDGARVLSDFCLWGAIPLFALALWTGGRRRAGNGLLIGTGVFCGVLLFLVVWAAVDFDGWFTAMHRLVFTNELWLLDPLESKLIQMLPGTFFEGAARTVVLRFGGWVLGVVALGVGLAHIPLKGKKTR